MREPTQRRTMPGRRTLATVVASGLLALALGSTPSLGQAEGEIPELTLGAIDYAFEWPDTIEAGRVAVTMDNTGQDLHHAQLVKLNEGVTADDAVAALGRMIEAEAEGGEAAAAAFAEFATAVSVEGGPGITVPGASQSLILDLEPGTYVWICALPAADDGQPHYAKGMLASFEVVAPETAVEAPEPASDGAVGLVDFAFAMPESVPAGAQRWEITNEGEQPHEILLAQLAPGATAMDFLQAFGDPSASAPPPGMPAGGLQAVMPGTTAWLDLDLAPGTYAAFCFVPDPGSGQPHIALGMVAEFTVVESTG